MIDDLNGVVCFIPSIVVGESMAIMSSNAVWVRYRTTPIVSISIDANTGVYSVHTEDVSYEILDLEKDQKRRKKRIVSTLYMESRILIIHLGRRKTRTDICLRTDDTGPRYSLLTYLSISSMATCTSGTVLSLRQVSSIYCMSRITSSITGISMIRFISPMMNPSAPSPEIMG